MSDVKENTRLTREQWEALPFFATSVDMSEILSATGISKATYYVWLKQPHFLAQVTKVREGVIARSVERMKILSDKCIQTLGSGLDSDDEKTRLKVANDLYNHLTRWIEIEKVGGGMREITGKPVLPQTYVEEMPNEPEILSECNRPDDSSQADPPPITDSSPELPPPVPST